MPPKQSNSSTVPRAAARGWASPRYWVAVVVMGLSAVGVQVLPGMIGVFLQKEAVPLKRPLQLFDAGRLAPRYVRHPASDRIPPMSEDMIDSLGTRDYVQIYLADTQTPAGEPTRVASLFVTYYTGQPDMVPHVPDECYLAGGYDSLGTSTERVRVTGVGVDGDGLSVRLVRFKAPQHRRHGEAADEVAVLYFFSVNGDYATTRNGVRAILSNPFQPYAYYAKIEVSFTDDRLVQSAGPEASVAALGPLLEAVLPVLYEDHFDLDKFNSAGRPGEAAQE